MKERKEYYSLNLNASEVIDVFTDEKFIEYCLGNAKLDIRAIEVKKDKDNILYLKLSGTKDNNKVVYNVYEFEVYEEKSGKEVFDKKWTIALQHYFYKVFGKSFIDAYNRVYNTKNEDIDITL